MGVTLYRCASLQAGDPKGERELQAEPLKSNQSFRPEELPGLFLVFGLLVFSPRVGFQLLTGQSAGEALSETEFRLARGLQLAKNGSFVP